MTQAHIVEFLNDRGDWIRKSYHVNRDHAEFVGQVTAKAGFKARVICDGVILCEWEPEE